MNRPASDEGSSLATAEPSSRSRRFPSTATAVAFPLGGIGSGNVSIGARGEFRDWEIFNSPGFGQSLPNTFWAIHLKQANAEPITKVLEARLNPPHSASHGYHPNSAGGLPRFHAAELIGEYPLVWVRLLDDGVPADVSLLAYTPLVPLDPADSGLPCALLNYRITNTSKDPMEVTVVGSLINPVGGVTRDSFGNTKSLSPGGNFNRYRDGEVARGIHLRSALPSDDLGYGDLSLATAHQDITFKTAWLRGLWYDDLREFWADLTADGRLTDLRYSEPADMGATDTASLGAIAHIRPGDTTNLRFVLAWYFPNRKASWVGRIDAPTTRNHYATRFADSWGVVDYVQRNRLYLESSTKSFCDAFQTSTLQPEIIDAVTANIVPVRSTTCFWLSDGGFYGYEGTFDDAGSCEGTCTHVWSYAYTVSYLFPSLERRMRETEFLVEIDDDGYLPFRSFREFGEEGLWKTNVDTFMDIVEKEGRLPPVDMIGVDEKTRRPPAAVDGQLGSILRVYREWQMCGDQGWLARLWPAVKRALSFAQSNWDPQLNGVLDGAQHTTYDVKFFGPNPLSSMYYIAALRAVSEMAEAMADEDLAALTFQLAQRGSDRVDSLLWNGEYFQQVVADLNSHPYQVGSGCLSDQLLGQFHASVLGLGYLVRQDHVRIGLESIFRHNYRLNLSDHVNPQRTFALNDEAGLLLCSWPRGGIPTFPFPYSDEIWSGIEYQVATQLLHEGLTEEATIIVGNSRGRQDGVSRSPWDEVECGHHYARAMSSWALLVASTGFRCHLSNSEISFEPVIAASTDPARFSAPWFCDRGWGIYTQERDPTSSEWRPSVTVLGGDMDGVTASACGKKWRIAASPRD